MAYLTIQRILKTKTAPTGWCIRQGDDGGLKLTFAEVVTPDKVINTKKTFSKVPTTRIAPGQSSLSRCVSQGIEVQITEWTIYKDILYVTDGQKIFRLLLTKSHGYRVDTYDSVSNRLGRCIKITRVYL